METNQTDETAAVDPAAPYSGSLPPAKKPKWNHSKQVLVWYAQTEQYSACYGIAYFHYDVPFRGTKEWVDFSGNSQGRDPSLWWNLPSSPND